MPTSVDGFDAWIEVEGTRLEEFQVKSSDDNSHITCWVPSEQGKEFTVVCSLPPGRVNAANHSVRLDIDGDPVSLSQNTVYQKDGQQNAILKRFSGGLVESKGTIRPFQFGALELTEDDSFLEAPTKSFGEIAVRVRSVEKWSPDIQTDETSCNPRDDYKIHERTKKGLSHCVRFGEERPIENRPFYIAHGIKILNTFVFKYRHIDILTADGIAPSQIARTNSGASPGLSGARLGHDMRQVAKGKRKAVNTKEEEAVDDLVNPVDDEIQSLKTRLAALEAEKAKRPDPGSGSRVPKRIKHEHQSTLIPGETIDLTKDSPPSGPSRSSVKAEPKSTLVSGEVIDLTL